MKKVDNSLGLLAQCVIAVFLIMFGVMTLFEKSFMIVTEALIILMMLILTYNNYKTFKRKYVYILYISVALLLLLDVFLKVNQ